MDPTFDIVIDKILDEYKEHEEEERARRIVRSTGSPKANYYLDKAYTILKQKAGSLDEEHQRRFLERVTMSRSIISASNI